MPNEGANTPGAETPATGSGSGAPPAGTPPAANETPKPDGKGAESTPPASKEGSALGKPTTSAATEIALSFPEGVVVDKELVDKFVPMAKEFGLKNEQAQKLANLYLDRVKAQETATTDAWKAQQKEWQELNRKDPDIGGVKYDANVEVARSAIEKFGGEALRKEIDALGIGDNPVLLKAWYQVGKAMAPDKALPTGAKPGAGANDEETQYRQQYPSMYNADGTRKRT